MTKAQRRLTNAKGVRGFTLIELMITVGVIAILAAIALPQYQQYIVRGQIAKAQENLAAWGTGLQQFYQDNRTYVNPTTAGVCPTGSQVNQPSNDAYWNYSSCIVSSSGGNFTATVAGVATNSATSSFTFILTESNLRATTSAPSGWPTSTSCWIINKAGVCS